MDKTGVISDPDFTCTSRLSTTSTNNNLQNCTISLSAGTSSYMMLEQFGPSFKTSYISYSKTCWNI